VTTNEFSSFIFTSSDGLGADAVVRWFGPSQGGFGFGFSTSPPERNADSQLAQHARLLMGSLTLPYLIRTKFAREDCTRVQTPELSTR
jgi:hypothetical protein